MNIEDRLRRVERQCRIYRHLFVFAGLMVIAMIVWGQTKPIPQVISARIFKLIGENGAVSADLRMHTIRGVDRNVPLLKFYRGSGENIVTIGESFGGEGYAHFTASDDVAKTHGSGRLWLGIDPYQHAKITLDEGMHRSPVVSLSSSAIKPAIAVGAIDRHPDDGADPFEIMANNNVLELRVVDGIGRLIFIVGDGTELTTTRVNIDGRGALRVCHPSEIECKNIQLADD